MAQSETTGHHPSDRTVQPEGLHLNPVCPKCRGKVHRRSTSGPQATVGAGSSTCGASISARVCVVYGYTELYSLESALGSTILEAFFGT